MTVVFGRSIAGYLPRDVRGCVWQCLRVAFSHGPTVDEAVEVLVGGQLVGVWIGALVVAVTLEGPRQCEMSCSFRWQLLRTMTCWSMIEDT